MYQKHPFFFGLGNIWLFDSGITLGLDWLKLGWVIDESSSINYTMIDSQNKNQIKSEIESYVAENKRNFIVGTSFYVGYSF
jgi:hypothetical protein